MSWSVVTSGANESWSDADGGVTQTWTATGSNTTNRNTSRFVLMSGVTYGSGLDRYVNLQPALRSEAASGRGGGFYITTDDPIALHTSGESTL